MFSGSGYNYDKPLFYYATMLMLEHKIDKLYIFITYDEQVMNKPIEELTKVMMDDINPVINEVLKMNNTANRCFRKSLGTIQLRMI